MSLDRVVYTILAANAGVTALIGTRVYTDKLPEGVAMPCAVITLIDVVPIHGIREDTDWRKGRVQIDVYNVSKQELVAATDAIKSALSRYRGAVGLVTVDDLLLDSERGDYTASNDTRVTMLDFIGYYKE